MVKALGIFWKDIVIIALVIVVSILSASNINQRRNNSILQNSLDSSFSIAHYYKNREGELIGQVKTQEITISELKDFKNEIGVEVDALRKQIGNLNRLVGHWQAKGTFVDYDTITVSIIDTTINNVDVGHFEWNNEHLSLSGYIRDRKVSLGYQYDLNFDLSLTAYWKDKNFFKRGTLVTDIKFSDQNMKVNEFKGIVIRQPPKQWYETRAAAFIAGGFLGLLFR